MALSFEEVFGSELEAINFRRAAVRNGRVAALRRPAQDAADAMLQQPGSHLRSDRVTLARPSAGAAADGSVTSRLGRIQDLTGISLSGGGVRSASLCLGVLQGLDSLSDHGDPHVLDAIDYLSTVSGGGYIGTSVVASMLQQDFSFPFRSRLDEEETPETQHLRDYSNFLAPSGTIDYLTSAALVVRGLVVNAIIVLPVLLVLAALTVLLKPKVGDLGTPGLFGVHADLLCDLGPFPLTKVTAMGLALILFGTALYTSWTFNHGSLKKRAFLGRFLAWALVALCAVAIVEVQPFVLEAMFAAGKGSKDPNGFVTILGRLAGLLAPLAAALIATAQRLANITKTTIGETTWGALIKKYASHILIWLAAIIVPLMLWIGYIHLCFWAIGSIPGPFNEHTPEWLKSFANEMTHDGLPGLGPIASSYLIAAVVVAATCLLIGPNANSLHRLYRDRLSRAFLLKRPLSTLTDGALDGLRFSQLKPRDENGWVETAALAPFLLVNTAINLEASRKLNKRGRNADTFIFSPLHVGSGATGYEPIAAMEAVVGDLTLPMAMATSGAAASANMGGATIKILTFSLSLLNIRLGYWLANPAKLADFQRPLKKFWANVGTWYFAKETAGLLDEDTLNVYLTDGGHVENLGIYELLKRRCKVILAVDAEGDAGMTFPSFVNLQVMARIDLGVRIDLPWEAIQSAALGVTSSALHGVDGKSSMGPHVAIGRIDYDDAQSGVLIYIKSSLTGDENDYIRDYKRRNSTFPHESTADQFFTEEQFEVYRALGFHAARNFFTGDDECAFAVSPTKAWVDEIASALSLLNIPRPNADAVVARLSAKIA